MSSPHPRRHWNGHAWSSVATPDPGGDAMLLGAAADRRGAVWAVGVGYDAQGEGHPLTERWDDRSWRIDPAPPTAGRGESLESVAVLAPDDVWAVGAASTPDGTSSPLVLHWNGRTWAAVAVPDVHADLHAVNAYGRGGLLAVGEQQGAATPALTLRWDGRAWHTEPAASDSAGQGASLFGVAAIPHPRPAGPTAWAVGSTLPRFDPPWRPIIQQFDRSWRSPTPLVRWPHGFTGLRGFRRHKPVGGDKGLGKEVGAPAGALEDGDHDAFL